MKRIIFVTTTVCLLAILSIASAETVQGIDMDFVTIGNAGNPGDTRTAANPYGGGAVDYEYKIGKYEVTNAQWGTFVAAAGAPTGNPSDGYDGIGAIGGSNAPVSRVSWYEVAQFCNYITSGDKSQGAYQFSGDNTNAGDFLGIDRVAAVLDYGTIYVIPTEDEWYKAAYYTGSGYSTYANGMDALSGFDANYNTGTHWNVGDGAMEQNGTFDMMGNLYEWNETPIGSWRGVRGGSYGFFSEIKLRSSYQDSFATNTEYEKLGVRIVSTTVPEPATFLLLGLGGLMLRRKR